MKQYIYLFTFVFLLLSCGKEDLTSFSGITETNQLGIMSGNEDKTDWQLDESWNQTEIELFDGLDINAANNGGEEIDFSTFETMP